MPTITKQEYNELLRDAVQRTKVTPQEFNQYLNRKGIQVEGLNPSSHVTQDVAIPKTLEDTGLAIADALPGLAGMAVGGPLGGKAAGLGARVLGRKVPEMLMRTAVAAPAAGAAGTVGEMARMGIYEGFGEEAPRSPAAEMVPGNLPQPLAEGAAQMGMQGLGEGIAAPFRVAGRALVKARIGSESLKHSYADIAMREGVELDIRGVKKIKDIVSKEIAPELEYKLRGAQFRTDAYQDLALPVWKDLEAMAKRDDNPEQALQMAKRKWLTWFHDPANGAVVRGLNPQTKQVMIRAGGTLTPQRLYEIKASTGAKIPTRLERREWGKMQPKQASQARWDAEFNEIMNRHTMRRLHEQMPEIVDLDQRASELLGLEKRIQESMRPDPIARMVGVGAAHGPALVLGGLAAQGEHQGGEWERIRNVLGGILAGEAMSSPRGVGAITSVLRNAPRVANTLGTIADDD